MLTAELLVFYQELSRIEKRLGVRPRADLGETREAWYSLVSSFYEVGSTAKEDRCALITFFSKQKSRPIITLLLRHFQTI